VQNQLKGAEFIIYYIKIKDGCHNRSVHSTDIMNIDINDGNQDMKAKIDEKEQAIQIKEARVIEAHYKI